MDPLPLLVIVLVAVILWLAWRVFSVEKVLRRAAEAPPASLQLLQREVHAFRAGVDERMREQLQQAAELAQRLGRLQKTTENVEQLGAGLEELQRILQPPQLRGAFGERMLEELLREMLPGDRILRQHTYRSSGTRVDAAVVLGEGRLLPIDAKFPLDNYRRYMDLRASGAGEDQAARRAFARDVRRHIDDVASRYVSPADGTVDVAFMYIPAEAVYHEMTFNRLDDGDYTLTEYALKRHVIPVSPNTLFAYLSVVRMGLRGFQLQKDARGIVQQLTQVQADVEALRTQLDVAVRQARHSLNNLTETEAALRRVEGRLSALGTSALDVGGS
ncbi:MAG: DNA recombination protein RmuC [Gemmatimonadota bacterium]|nr:MAG: DNA recombination protein RmuC [Gemmatimonadota bacterium]